MKTGHIYGDDIGPVIRSIGLKPSEAQIRAIKKDIGQGQANLKYVNEYNAAPRNAIDLASLCLGGKVDLEQLVRYISQGVTEPPAERPEDLNEMFRLYDVTGSGFISVAEMTHLMTTIGEKLTDEEVQLLLRQTRCVDNGRVNYKSQSHFARCSCANLHS